MDGNEVHINFFSRFGNISWKFIQICYAAYRRHLGMKFTKQKQVGLLETSRIKGRVISMT